MKIPLVGPSSQQRAFPFNAERTVNYIAIADKDGKNASCLLGAPGLLAFTSVGSGPGRGSFTAAATGRYFVASGNAFYEVFSDGTSVKHGDLVSTTGVVQMEENGTQLYIGDGQYGYIFTYATNTFAQITDPDFPVSVGTVCFVGGYFIVNQNGTGKFYVSDLYNGLSWQALNFATAESSPDNLLRVIAVQGQLWLMGSLSAEVWTPNGSTRFPFELISGAVIDMGIISPYAAQAMDNTIFWVGTNREGGRTVYRATGFIPQRISTEPMEKLLAQVTNLASLRTWKYQEEGHVFLMITGGGLETTLCYDLTTQLWTERATLDSTGEYDLHRGADCSIAFGKTLVIDRENAKIYQMSLDFYSDDGAAMPSDRIFTHLSQENVQARHSELVVDIEVGVGLQNGQGVNPQGTLSLSNDGAKTWFGSQTKSIGRVGKYLTRVVFWRLGIARTRTYRFRITDPVRRCLFGLYLNV